MALVIGIDEAGYGPMLGPLVVGATLWDVAGDLVGSDLWDRLRGCVTRADGRGGRLTVGDSKQVFDRKKGIATLERTVLTFAHAAGIANGTLREFLGGLCESGRLSEMPWYRDLDEILPIDPIRSANSGICERVTEHMQAGGVICRALMAQVVAEDGFNQRVAQTRNKASVLIEQILRLIDRGARVVGDGACHVFVDRLGGRDDYRSLLMSAFPGRTLHIVEMTERRSAYCLQSPSGSDWTIEFVVEGDQQHLPIALASMLAKYVRELLMARFNAYWRNWIPTLRPTAGYYQDAERFMADIGPSLDRVGVSAASFVRAR